MAAKGKKNIFEEEVIEVLNAIGHPIRVRILRLLKEHLADGVKYATLAKIFRKKGGALDFHLNRLKKPSLIRGSNGTYRLDSRGLDLLEVFDDLLKGLMRKR